MIDLTPMFIAEYQELQRDFDRLRAGGTAYEEEAERLRSEVQDLCGQRDRLQEQLQQAERELQEARRERQESDTQVERPELDKSQLTRQLSAAHARIAGLEAAVAACSQAPALPPPREDSGRRAVPSRSADGPLLRCPHCRKFMLPDEGDASAPVTCLFCGGAID